LPSTATTTTRRQNRFGAAPSEGILGEEVVFWKMEAVRFSSAESYKEGDGKMKKRLIVLLAVIVVLSMVSIPALAGPPQDAGGAWYYLPTGMVVDKVAGGNTFVSISDVGYWTGTIAGDEVDVGTAVIHLSGRWSYTEGILTFESAVVGGRSGGLEMRVRGSRPDIYTDWEGQWLITAATGGLEGLRGQGTWWGPGWQGDPNVHGVVYYSGKIHFESD
jgi:hypothetical protein